MTQTATAIRSLNLNYTNPISYPIDIFYGEEAISGLPDILESFGRKRALIVCGPNTLASGIIERAVAALGPAYVGTFSKVGEHVPADTLIEAAELGRTVQPDIIISVGGGSAHDTSKALAMVIAGGGEINEYDRYSDSHNRTRDVGELMPIVAVPTTIACAEISPGGGGTVTDRELGRKWAFTSKPGRRAVVIDGRALATTPARIQRSTPFSQFRVAMESISGPACSPVGEALALQGVRQMAKLLPGVPKGDPGLLVSMKVAACLTSLARFHSPSSAGISTAICHQAGGLFNVPHGEIHGILLPHAMHFNLDATAERQALIADAIGVDVAGLTDREAALAGAERFAAFCASMGNPTRLRDAGITKADLRTIAEATWNFESGIHTNPRKVEGPDDIEGILENAW